ncbi:MAG: hypothetical protein ABR928_18580 [Terracidiphilus sp.]
MRSDLNRSSNAGGVVVEAAPLAVAGRCRLLLSGTVSDRTAWLDNSPATI